MKTLKSKIVILLTMALIIAQFGCRNKEENPTAKIENPTIKNDEKQAKDSLIIDCVDREESGLSGSNSANRVFINGKTDDLVAFKYFNVLRFSGLGYGM